ncbi:MAG TPA: restriction endonuclease subunit S [Nitrospira sp.]|nr:restriction endonuclease subunit S [Nitrospira sp.]
MAGDDFERTTFGDLISEGSLEIGDGYRAKNEELGGDGPIFLRAGHVTDTHIDFSGVERFHSELESRVRSKLAKPGDAVVTTKGNSTGRTTFVTASMPPFVYSPHLSYWRSKDPTRVEGGFLRYWSKGAEFTGQLAGMKASTDMAPYLSLVDQKRLRISLPPIAQQRSIALILGTLDDKIELNRRMNETLEAMARALFSSWFVDFNPVRANAEGRDTGLPKHLDDFFSDSFEDSELGEIPRGWEIKAFADTIEIVGGGTPKTSVAEYWDGDIPWFSVVDSPTDSDVWVVDTEKKVTHAGVENSSTRVLPEGTTIISARGTVGRIALVSVPMAMNQSCYGLRGRAEAHGFFTYFSTRELVARLQQHAHGSVFDTITRDTLAGVSVVAPAAALIEEFEKRVAPILHRIRVGLLETRTLAALRDALLPKLISGELRVPEGTIKLGGRA